MPRAIEWADAGRSLAGACRWCGLAIGSERRKGAKCHKDCFVAYSIAVGDHYIGAAHAAMPDECANCGAPAADVDHRLAICVAREMDSRAWMRAFTIENLQGLCRACHVDKTRADRLLAAMLRGRGIGYKEAVKFVSNLRKPRSD